MAQEYVHAFSDLCRSPQADVPLSLNAMASRINASNSSLGDLADLAEELSVQLALFAIHVSDKYAIARGSQTSTSLLEIAKVDIRCSSS
jgi:hypothetical protein